MSVVPSGSGESHVVRSYVGVAVAADEKSEPQLQDAIHHAAELALADEEARNAGQLFDVRIQVRLSNPHIKEVRATITKTDSP